MKSTPNYRQLPQYTYTLGKVEGHNVVLACLPAGRPGTNPAAVIISHINLSFPNVRYGLMVGIGGGVPSETDLRLGDVVVSKPTGSCGGVVQYDFGKNSYWGTA
jgi:nucleoside phosphorylase